MKTRLFYKLLILLTISLLFWRCETDVDTDQQNIHEKKLEIKISHWHDFELGHRKIANSVGKYRHKNSSTRDTHSSQYGFHIDEEQIQIIEDEGYTTYTFLVKRENPQEGILENYLFKEFSDGSYKQFLLTYYYTFDSWGNRVFDTTHMGVEVINDEGLIVNRTSSGSGNCHPHFEEVYLGFICTTVQRCYGENAGAHEVGDVGCPCQVTKFNCWPAGSTVCEHRYGYTFDDCSGGLENTDVTNPNNPDNPPTGGSAGPGANTGFTNTVPFDLRLGQFEYTLDGEELNWWRNPENSIEVNNLKLHLFINDYSDIAKEYVRGSIELENDCKL